MTGAIEWLDRADVLEALPPAVAVDVIEAAALARRGADPGPPRSVVPVTSGQLLLMPAEGPDGVGVKLVTVAPANPSRGAPRIQAVYLLCDPDTLTPVALLEGTSLTELRTAAVSGVAIRHLAPDPVERMLVLGSGPQARAHTESALALREVGEVVVASRNATTAQALVEEVARSGQRCRLGEVSEVAAAQLVVCATSAAEPLFAGQEVAEDALVVAVGSHEPDRRELDSTLLGRASVVVEDVDTALREAGDVVIAMAEGALSVQDLIDLPTLLGDPGEVRPGAPRVFKSVGMAWQDLAVATEVLRRRGRPAKTYA